MRRNLIDEQTMNTHEFLFADVTLVARASGALYWPDQQLLVISDLPWKIRTHCAFGWRDAAPL